MSSVTSVVMEKMTAEHTEITEKNIKSRFFKTNPKTSVPSVTSVVMEKNDCGAHGDHGEEYKK